MLGKRGAVVCGSSGPGMAERCIEVYDNPFCQNLQCQKVRRNVRRGKSRKAENGFCDFGRKLENLSMPVHAQCCAATDGSTSPNVPGRHI